MNSPHLFALSESDPFRIEAVQKSELHEQPGNIPAFSEVAAARPNLWRAFCISTNLQTAILVFMAGKTSAACILLSVLAFFTSWRWTSQHSKQRWLLFAFAAVALALALLPWRGGGLYGLFGTGEGLHRRPARSLQSSGEQERSSYVGIVLWPPAKKIEIVQPPSPAHLLGSASLSKPLVIPFTGQYWYFKAPDHKPSPRARIVHEKPTMVDIHSTDWLPLLMEAHQNLSSAINMDCCREIDVTITNADNRPGRITIGVALTDSASPGKPSQYLGEKTIVSSEAVHFSMNRAPVEETLCFPTPHGKLRRFDQISVVFLPAKERSRGGAKVSIEHFKLIPR